MRTTLIIGPIEQGADRFRHILKVKSALLEKHGVLSPDWNHIRLYMACSNTDQPGVVRFKRGFEHAAAQNALYQEIGQQLERRFERDKPDHLVLTSGQIGAMLSQPEELQRLHDLLAPFSDEIRVVAHLQEQSTALAAHYANRVSEGRQHPLDVELTLAQSGESWWDGALARYQPSEPLFGLFNDIQHPPFWLDYQRLYDEWAGVFGTDAVHLRPLDLDHLYSEQGAEELNTILETDLPVGKLDPDRPGKPPGAARVARTRQFNAVLIPYMQALDLHVPRDVWRRLLSEFSIGGPAIDPGSLSQIAARFAKDNTDLIAKFPDLASALGDTPTKTRDWVEAETGQGFRASQHLTAMDYQLRRNSPKASELRAERQQSTQTSAKFDELLPDIAEADGGAAAKQRLINTVEVNHQIVLSTQMRPHNDLGSVDENSDPDPYSETTRRTLKPGHSGNVIVGCMKNEAPYIIEWVAYHRAIGVDNFLIYTNGCEDGTNEILGRLQDMGVVQHRLNEHWTGNSPQQFALNAALEEPVIKEADWLIHIDVDEFMNIRCGNGTLDDLFKAVPDATNIAMTWRLFGHNGVTRLQDDLVIDQFDTCAPKFCPKPHTVWGFKTMFKNLGAYARMSCHRPNKLDETFETKIKWVNGSGEDMTRDAIKNGWRNSKKNIGYDLIQLNHYALRSAESFLIKRQRGRALHVDRSIGLNYWIRMDWGDYRDQTIKRNIPRVQAEYDRLMEDDKLRDLHESGLNWHRAKAKELHKMPEFQDLFDQALKVKLSETERVAYALALDLES